MSGFLQQFDNRELSLFALIGIFLFSVILFKNTRTSTIRIIKILFSGSIFTILLLITLYFTTALLALQIAGFWEFYLLKNSLLWLVTVGFLGILTLDLKAVSNNTFKKFFKDIFKITIVFEFITATYVFSFGIEMLILLVSIVLVWLKLFTETKLRYDCTSEYRSFQRFLNFAITSIGFIIIWYTSKSLIENPSTLLSLKKLKEFILPLILSLLYAPLYWLIICVTAYETSFKRIQYSATDNRINLFNKIIVFLRCGLSLNRLKKLENSTNTFHGNQKELRSYIRNISFSRSTGLYKSQYGRLTELQAIPGSGSINDIIQSLGWNRNEIHVVHLFDSDIFEFIGFNILSKKPIFAQTRDGIKNLHFSVLNTTIEKIAWKTEYSADNVDEILNEGILNGDLHLEFLQNVILLTKISSQKYYCSELEMSFIFKDEKLIKFEHIEHLESSTKWLRSLNADMYEGMVKEAEIYQKSKKDVTNEVNKQSEALMLIPKAVENKYIKLHRTKIGNTSFYNLRAAHYLPPLDKNEFLKVNSGRFKEIDKNTFNVDKFLYFFNEQDTLYKSKAC